MISAVVLAAGASMRMGRPKALLTIGAKTFLQNIIEALHSARILDVVVVLGSDAGTIREGMSWFDGKIVVNPAWQNGQLSSIIAGLDGVSRTGVHGVMICPVDHPLLSQGLLVGLLQAYWQSRKRIIIPVCEGRRGHPVIFDASLFDALRSAPGDVGARAVIRAHPGEVNEVAVTDRGVLSDIDTPEDYEALRRIT